MRVSYTWLKELTGVELEPDEMAERLTSAGLEVEGTERYGTGLDGVVVAEVRGRRPHPKRDKLQMVTVFDGEAEQEVVCGAPNVPDAGGRVLFARLGAELPNGMRIEERKIGGEVSRGMICSEVELDIGVDADGIVVLDPADTDAHLGTPIADALGLKDVVFELGLTPNRPDCLGHVGVARDLAAIVAKTFAEPPIRAPSRLAEAAPRVVPETAERTPLESLWQGSASERAPLDGADRGPIAVDIAAPERCPRYGAALVLGIDPSRPSPFWLRYRLHRLGVRSVSAAVDVTNLVLLEHGHPIHGFDLRKVRGRRIEVRLAREGETMTTIDHVDRTFAGDDLLICDGEGPVAVAGVMGGAMSEIGDDTTDVLIECAYFDPRSVRRTARRHGLHTDASHRFERGVDPNAVPKVMARAASLLAEVCGGAVDPHALDVHPRPVEPARVRLRIDRAASVLGVELGGAEASRTLEALGCGVHGSGAELDVQVPTFRPDLQREVDLIEELGRVAGYDRIPTQVPRVRPSARGLPPLMRLEGALRRQATSVGLYEVVNYSFVSERELADAAVSTEVVPVFNPLSEERAVMRTSLLPGLVANARHARRRQVEQVCLFEVGRTYHPEPGAPLPREGRVAAVLLCGPRSAWIGPGNAMDFYDAKGVVEQLLPPVVGASPVVELSDDPAPYLHPRKQAAVEVAGHPVGRVGQIHPEVADRLELDVAAFFVELDTEALLHAQAQLGVPQAAPLPRYPAVHRDIAMVVDEAHEVRAIATTLSEAAGGLVEGVELFDLYRGDPVPAGKKSVAFRITYRDPEATLTDKRVDKLHKKAAEAAQSRLGAQLRE